MFKVFTIIAIISYNILINLLKKRISDMSLLTVTGLTHGFGDRAIFNNVSFQLNRLDKIGLVGANGEGKSTFMNIITGKLMPDEGKVEWAKNVRVGYLDQHAVLEKGMTIQSVLASAFDFLYDMENQMNEIYAGLGDASPEEMDKLMAEAGTIQDLLTMHDFYMIDAKVEEVARALGLSELGLDKDVTELSGGQRTKVLLGKLLLEKPDILLLDEPTAALDPKTASKVLKITDEIVTEQHLTTLMITHNMRDALKYGNRLIMMNSGRIIADYTPEEKKNLTIEDLLKKFEETSGTVSDRVALG